MKDALQERVPIISMNGGNPTPLFEELNGGDVKNLVG